ncbi:MAG: M28 family peptidase [Reichenbachiella sp.]
MKYFLILFFSFSIHPSHSQYIDYAKSVVEQLASDELKGRGYVEGGDQLAADYIKNQFQEFDVLKLGKDFFQPFELSVNTFPSAMTLSFDGQSLTPGKDFLINPNSPSISGTFKSVLIDASLLIEDKSFKKLLKQSKSKVLIIKPFNKNDFDKEDYKQIQKNTQFLLSGESPIQALIQMTTDKLTWSASQHQSIIPLFTVVWQDNYSDLQSISIDVAAKHHANYTSQNIVGFIEGQNKDSLIVLTAHYDHLGMMGSTAIFPGANDNASGVAMLLSLAKHYQDFPPKYNTVLIAFGGEELGLLGSQYFVQNPMIDLSIIKLLLNFDIAGTGDEGIQVVNGSVYRKQFDLLSKINKIQNYLPQVKIRGEACNSDHCLFHMKGVPSFFIYTLGGIQAYHDIYDRSETLPLTEFEDYFRLITTFLRKL